MVFEVGDFDQTNAFGDRSPNCRIFSFKSSGKSKSVMSCSFPGLGLQAAQNQYLVSLPLMKTDGDRTRAACYPRGFLLTDKTRRFLGTGSFEDCFASLCFLVESWCTRFEKDLELVKNILGTKPTAAQQLFRKLVPFVKKEPTPLVFFAVENFFYTPQFFRLTFDKNPKVFRKLLEHGEVFCRERWEVLQTKHPEEPLHDLKKYCFSAIYLHLLVYRFAGLEQNQKIRLRKRIDGKDISWTLGSVLYDLFYHSVEKPDRQRKGRLLFTGFVLFVFGLFVRLLTIYCK